MRVLPAVVHDQKLVSGREKPRGVKCVGGRLVGQDNLRVALVLLY